ncbi:RNA-binding domain-containing protein [Desulfovibrio piger]
MESAALHVLLHQLLAAWENEVVEFKEASKDYKTAEIFQYFSALSNEANLRGANSAWLVFGVRNKDKQIVGTDFRLQHDHLHSLKQQVKQSTGSISFREIHELIVEGKRVLLFEIPPAPRGMPVFANGHAYARAGESLKGLDMFQLDTIRNQTLAEDWSAQLVDGATTADLDQRALQKARQDFIQKHANRLSAEEVMGWSEEAFLGKLRLLHKNKLTRAALLLFGKPEASVFLSPHPAQLTWKLEGEEKAYEHFGLPFYLTSSELYKKIRNIQLRILPDDSLVPREMSKYDQKVIMEGLHNCIMHQDYRLSSRIIVTEYIDKIKMENAGDFFEGKPADYIEGNCTPRKYRNTCLSQAMTELNMVDSMGIGISQIYKTQAKRYFPLPDYALSEDSVSLTIYGKVVDPAYTRLLIQKTDISLSDILALDRIQKGLPIEDKNIIQHLRRANLIEGRKPHFHISAAVARLSPPESRARYVRMKGQSRSFYEEQILRFLRLKAAPRHEIEVVLLDQLSTALSTEQKKRQLGNLLLALKRKGKVRCKGVGKASMWEIVQEEGCPPTGKGDIA